MKLRNFLGAVKDLILMPFKKTPVRKLGTLLLWTPKKIGWVLRKILHGIVIGPSYVFRAIIKSPKKAFRKAMIIRDWMLEKIDYLEAESAKWKRTFQIIKSPYSLLLKMGFSPQYAIGLIAVGTTATTGVASTSSTRACTRTRSRSTTNAECE